MVLGYRIRRLRKDNLMSQEELGQLIGVSKVSVSGYESGNRVPSIMVLEKMVDVLNTSTDYILGREINAVCEDDDKMNVVLSSEDINIINEIKKDNKLYSKIVRDPKRFFAAIYKNSI